MTQWQPRPQALRFSQGGGERLVMSCKVPWEGTDGRRSTVSPDVSFPPSFARARDVWVRSRHSGEIED